MTLTYQVYADGRFVHGQLVNEKGQPIKESQCAADLFWLGSAVPLLIVILHVAREWCFPGRYKRKLLFLYSYDLHIQPPRQPVAKPLIYDSGRKHDNATGMAVEDNTIVSNKKDENTAFEDEHVIVLNKQARHLIVKSPWIFCWDKFEYFRLPPIHEDLKLILASFLNGIQFYVYRQAGYKTLEFVHSCKSQKQTALLGFMGPMVFMFVTSVMAMRSVKAIKESSQDTRSWIKKPVGFLILMNLTYLLIPFCRILCA